MNIFRSIARAFVGDPGEPVTLDHLPVTGAVDWRTERLAEAAKRHGKAFKCAAEGLPREVNGVDMTNVTQLPIRKSQ